MLDMANRPKKSDGEKKRGRPPGRKPAYTIHVRIQESIGDAMDAFAAAQDFPPTTTAVVEHALKRYLSEQGFWPWPRPSS